MTTLPNFNLSVIDPSWISCIHSALGKLHPDYVAQLTLNNNWLPGKDQIFNAFSLPLNKVNYVLFGESPYPRRASANGYAFWDANVQALWSESGLSKTVNRATSLRNIIKMLLLAEEALFEDDLSQTAIAKLNKAPYVQNGPELFQRFIKHGFLLLNTTLALQAQNPQHDAKAWRPFMAEVLKYLAEHRPQTEFLLFGRIATTLDPLINHLPVRKVYAEHPYNLSFTTNRDILSFFKPLHLLMKE